MQSQADNENRGCPQHESAELADVFVAKQVKHHSPAREVDQRKQAV